MERWPGTVQLCPVARVLRARLVQRSFFILIALVSFTKMITFNRATCPSQKELYAIVRSDFFDEAAITILGHLDFCRKCSTIVDSYDKSYNKDVYDFLWLLLFDSPYLHEPEFLEARKRVQQLGRTFYKENP